MTPDEKRSATDDEDVCPHCGAVLDLLRAMEQERTILTRSARRSPRPDESAGP